MQENPKTSLASPLHFALQILGNKWVILILSDLIAGKKRTSELLKGLTGISPRTLSERLRELETSGLISRTAYAEIPPRVEYQLTATGAEVQPLLVELAKLGEKWKAQVHLPFGPDERCLHCEHEQSEADSTVR